MESKDLSFVVLFGSRKLIKQRLCNDAESTNPNCATLKMIRSLGMRGNFFTSRVSQGGYTMLLCDGALLDKNKHLTARSGGKR